MQCKLDLALYTFTDNLIPIAFIDPSLAPTQGPFAVTVASDIATVLYDTATQKFIPDILRDKGVEEWIDFKDIRAPLDCHPCLKGDYYHQSVRLLGAENLGRYIQSYPRTPTLYDAEQFVLACRESGQVIEVTMNYPRFIAHVEVSDEEFMKKFRYEDYVVDTVQLDSVITAKNKTNLFD